MIGLDQNNLKILLFVQNNQKISDAFIWKSTLNIYHALLAHATRGAGQGE